MKSFKIVWILIVVLPFAACDTYLDQTPAALISEETIFTNYPGIQGYLDQCYSYVVEYNFSISSSQTMNYAGESANTKSWCTEWWGEYGDYLKISGVPPVGITGLFNNTQANAKPDIGKATEPYGIYGSGWEGIRVANLTLSRLSMLKDATEEEKRLIEGQAYFFRAFFYAEMVRAYGGLPYIDKFLEADDDLDIPRQNYHETTERIIEDFDRAAALLPEDWDDTNLGSQFRGANRGRATKGAALAFKARCLLYAGSPLMNYESTGSYDYNMDYMKRAAQAANDILDMVNRGVYSLVDFEEYYTMFARTDGSYPWTSETIFQRTTLRNSTAMSSSMRSKFVPNRMGGSNGAYTVTQNTVDEFDMVTTGLPIDDPESGYDPLDPWSNRDPRFRGGILVDGDVWTKKDPEAHKIQSYKGGVDDNQHNRTAYFCKKFWPLGVNDIDMEHSGYAVVTPHIRLAEIYLIYAEAVNEAFGPLGRAEGADLTAVEALNMVRNRAGMPDLHTKFTSSKEEFRKRLWSENYTEFFLEGHRWFDIRRWHVAHLIEFRELYDMEFDKDHTYFNRVLIGTRIFEDKHYWLPFPTEQTKIYPGFYQNPGW